MARPGCGTVGVASVATIILALCPSRGVQAFVTPLTSSKCGFSAGRPWHGHGHRHDGIVVGNGNRGVRARTPTGLEVAAGGSTVESSSVAEEDDGMRVKQIEGFSKKVCVSISSTMILLFFRAFVCVRHVGHIIRITSKYEIPSMKAVFRVRVLESFHKSCLLC